MALPLIVDETRTRGGMWDDLPRDVDPPSRQELGLADPVRPGFTDFTVDYRDRWR